MTEKAGDDSTRAPIDARALNDLRITLRNLLRGIAGMRETQALIAVAATLYIAAANRIDAYGIPEPPRCELIDQLCDGAIQGGAAIGEALYDTVKRSLWLRDDLPTPD